MPAHNTGHWCLARLKSTASFSITLTNQINFAIVNNGNDEIEKVKRHILSHFSCDINIEKQTYDTPYHVSYHVTCRPQWR